MGWPQTYCDAAHLYPPALGGATIRADAWINGVHMLLRVSALVVAYAEVQDPFELTFADGFKVAVESDDEGFWNRVIVTKRVDDWRCGLPQVVLCEEELPVEPTVGQDPNVNPQLLEVIAILQHLESMGGYVFGVRSIDWQTPDIEWIPESPEENRQLSVRSMTGFRRSYEHEPYVVDETEFARAVLDRKLIGYLDIPLSFFREATIEFESFRYISAFFNYYFFLEGLYGRGKSSEKAMRGQLLASEHIRAAVDEAMTLFEKSTSRRHFLNVRVFLDENALPWSRDGVVALLVRMRNRLHHYSNAPTPTRRGHPLSHDDYESVAFLASAVCVFVLNKLLTGERPR